MFTQKNKNTKRLAITIFAVCVAATLALYCSSLDFDNPIDPKFSYTLTVNAGNGGTVSITPEQESYAGGTSVTVRAVPNTSGGYMFSRWTGASTSTNSTITVIMDRDRTLTANFELQPPTGVTAIPVSSSSITVRWNAVQGVTGYAVHRVTSSGATIKTDSTTQTSITITGLSFDTTYYYQVSAYNNLGMSLRSSMVSAKPEFAAPQNVTATADSPSDITISWDEVVDAVGYYIYSSTSSNGDFTQVGSTSSATETSWTNSGLNERTRYWYYVAAYNDIGTVGPQSSTVSARTLTYGPLHDPRDGKTYRIVVMPDDKEWMAENLNFATSSGSRCYYDDPANCEIYGRLYDWATAMNLPSSCNSTSCASQIQTRHQGICPDGWWLPSVEDWWELENAVGGSSVAARHLKAEEGWIDCGPIGSGNSNVCENTYGFSALPGGKNMNGWGGEIGFWWSATERTNRNDEALNWEIWTWLEHPSMNYSLKSDGLSVRCVRD